MKTLFAKHQENIVDMLVSLLMTVAAVGTAVSLFSM